MKEKRILDVLLRSNIGDMKDEELNELKEIVNKEYEKRQEKRRELLESIKKRIYFFLRVKKLLEISNLHKQIIKINTELLPAYWVTISKCLPESENWPELTEKQKKKCARRGG